MAVIDQYRRMSGGSNQSPMLSNRSSWEGCDGSIVGTCIPVFTVVYVYAVVLPAIRPQLSGVGDTPEAPKSRV